MRGNFIAAWVTQQQRAFRQSTRGIMTPEDRQILEGEAEKAMVEVERAAAEKAWHEGFCAGERSGEREMPLNPYTENPYRREETE